MSTPRCPQPFHSDNGAGLFYTIHLYEMARNTSSSVEREQIQRIGRRFRVLYRDYGFLARRIWYTIPNLGLLTFEKTSTGRGDKKYLVSVSFEVSLASEAWLCLWGLVSTIYFRTHQPEEAFYPSTPTAFFLDTMPGYFKRHGRVFLGIVSPWSVGMWACDYLRCCVGVARCTQRAAAFSPN